MSFLRSLFGGSPHNENTTKPFHANKTLEERKDWFSRTKPWHKVDARVIEAVASRLDSQPLMFEIFVQRSMDLELVNKYRGLDAGQHDARTICAVIAAWLTQFGAHFGQQLSTATDRGAIGPLVGAAIDVFEVAVVLEPRSVQAYCALAVLMEQVGKPADALRYARTGLDAINELRRDNPPFHLSSIESIRNTGQTLAQAEAASRSAIPHLEARV